MLNILNLFLYVTPIKSNIFIYLNKIECVQQSYTIYNKKCIQNKIIIIK